MTWAQLELSLLPPRVRLTVGEGQPPPPIDRPHEEQAEDPERAAIAADGGAA